MKSVTWKIDFGQRLKQAIAVSQQCCLGVYVEEKAIHLAEVSLKQNVYSVRFCEPLTVFAEEELSSELVAERVKQFCLQKFIATENVAICLPEGSMWWMQINMPAMPEREIAGAVKWQIEAKDPFNGGKYWHSYIHTAEGKVFVAAISQQDGEELQNNFAQADLRLRSITLCKGPLEDLLSADGLTAPAGELEMAAALDSCSLQNSDRIAIYTAMSALQSDFLLNAMPKQFRLENVAWKKLSNLVAIAAILFALTLFGSSFFQLRQSQKELAAAQSRAALSERREKLMLNLQAKQDKVANKEKILAGLSKERLSSYALLINFGTLDAKGIRLTEIGFGEKGSCYCQGKAESYDALVNYLKEINESKQSFPGGASLLESKMDENGLLDFSLKAFLKAN